MCQNALQGLVPKKCSLESTENIASERDQEVINKNQSENIEN